MKGFKVLLLVLAAPFVCFESNAAAAENVLRWASAGGAATFDPHAYDDLQTAAQYHQTYEALVAFDSNLELVPQLATTWRLIDRTTWEFEPGGRYVLVRNPDWWGAQYYRHNIDPVIHLPIDGTERRRAALLNGEIELLQDPPFEALEVFRRTPGLKVTVGKKFLTKDFHLNQSVAELRSSNVRSRNPFKDKRVRQAINHAINIEAMLHPLMGDFLVPAGMPIPPGVNGYSEELDQRLDFDLKQARALLAEAGYPNGFSVTLDCPNDWGATRSPPAVRQPRSSPKWESKSQPISFRPMILSPKPMKIGKAISGWMAGIPIWIQNAPFECSTTAAVPGIPWATPILAWMS